ncbi:MAG TPA: hypothetical protein VFG15_03410 [Amycolatopsis sp.]|nr:hypothetical protein [Amycolatopsis sp.]
MSDPQHPASGSRDTQVKALIEIVGALAQNLRRVERKVGQSSGKKSGSDEEEDDLSEPGAWVLFTPPAAAEDDPASDQDPRRTIENFVTWYNLTFVGVDGGRARPIPDCWRQHDGLAMEVATLAYSWRAANVGPGATPRDAQQWLHQWRPGFSDRLVRDWVLPDCLDGDHRDTGSPPRPDRFDLAEQHAAALAQAKPPI